jgi:hypothetical protein
MSDDEMADGIRRSPRKAADGQPVMPADAARNILQNKKTQKGTKRDAPDKITVGTKAAHKKRVRLHPHLKKTPGYLKMTMPTISSLLCALRKKKKAC